MKKNLRQGNGTSIKELKQRISKKPKKILVPLDGSKNAFRGLKYAIKNARIKNQKIIGVYVVKPVLQITHVSVPGLLEYLRKDGKKTLDKAQKQCDSKNIDFDSKLLLGDPGEKIVEFSKKNKIDEIIMGTSNKGKLSRAFFGSTANHVIHKTKLPTTIIK